MKKLIYTLIAMTCSSYSFAQIPNPDFENWTTTTTMSPAGWKSFGQVSQISPGTEGNYAIRIEQQSTNNIGAIIYGTPPQGTGSDFSGGIPFAAHPDSLIVDFKYDIPVGDSALVICMLKNAGSYISQNVYYITGSHSSGFVRKAFALGYFSGLNSDSLIIAFTSTNPDANFLGGYVAIDNIHFTNTIQNVPNAGFENWITIPNEEPNGWFTSNGSVPNYSTLPVTKTTDKYSGSFAVRIENVNTPNGVAMGYVLAGPQGQNGLLPGFPVSERNSAFNGYYKFSSQNNDTLTIGILMFEMGVQVGGGFFQNFANVSSYSAFNATINYNGGYAGTPDSATIFLLPFQGGSEPHGNSVLYVDSLSLSPTISVGITESKENHVSISNYPNPCSDYTLINYSVQENAIVSIKLFDIIGREVAVLFNGNQTAGSHGLKYDSGNLDNGIYHLIIESNSYKQDRKVVVQK